LTCSQYEPKHREGCIAYISTLVLGYSISASYFLTAIISTWIWTGKDDSQTNSNSNSNTNANLNPNQNPTNSNINNNCNSSSPKSSPLNRTKLSKLDETNYHDLPQTITITQDEFVAHNKHLLHLFNEDSEFNRTDGTIVIFRRPSPSFLKYEPSSRNSSLYENNSSSSKYTSEYSLDSSFSRIYGSIIIPRKYTSQSETDNSTSSTMSKYDGSIIIDRGQINSTYSENSTGSKRLSSSLSEETSRSSNYDGSIIIKLVM